MVIQALKLVLAEGEIAEKLRLGLSSAQQLKDVTVGLEPGTVKLGGKFQVGFSIPFETQWTASVMHEGRRLGVRLSAVSVGMLGMNKSMATTQIMSALAQKLQGVSGVAVEEDLILLDPSTLLSASGIHLDAVVKRIDVLPGRVEIEVG